MNISWSHVPSIAVISSVNQTYSLTVSHGSHSKTLPLRQPHYYFTAPEGAPPCEVYNFSVTATYDIVGATYTGADCSVPSPVLSSMLPSLPNITKLESSLDYSLEINSSGGVAMRVSFMVSCLLSHLTTLFMFVCTPMHGYSLPTTVKCIL